MKLKLFVILIVSLIFVNLAYAATGVGSPFPSTLELKPGESGRFQFEIQSTPEEGVVTCKYNIENPIPLTVEFDEQSVLITPTGQTIRMPVYATVTVPMNITSGSYSSSFCVSCAPAKSGNPVGALGSYCGITFSANVVGERTRENPYVPPKQQKINPFMLSLALIIIIILVILSVIITKRLYKHHY